ncbi:hypothetical protein Poli38472_006142 [Pythium oligandrum]|uniref:TRP C-terminal domain-containing protein n=1 Tax=Pythium oligandrum TaxID=41045 RepID=A0A8K1CSZ1_PYTOL|nr:hypothetical protein Poli38472_006142 [Pythium oligandrum]|eukprot:TMW68674.1 hypothetical protein Poli38472_006142 [Pythium oligandrum]
MGLLTSPVCCAVKCCGCIILSQIISLLISLGLVLAFIAFFYFYLVPWGEDKLAEALGLPDGTDIGSIDPNLIAKQNCSGCVFGTNTDWPTKTNGTLHFLDTSAGTTISSGVAVSLVASAAAGAGTMIWASLVPSMASALSLTGGFYEMTHIFEQAQYISMIGQLQLHGAPEFLNQFSKELAWTNFNLPKSVTDAVIPGRRLDDLVSTGLNSLQPSFSGDSGPAKYAKMLGVEPKNLFFYTLLMFGALLVLIHVLFVIVVVIMTCINKKKSFGQIAGQFYRKVIWACILALLMAQYIFAMAGSYYIYESTRGDGERDSNFYLGCLGLAVAVGFAVLFGVLIVANNTDELKDIGSVEHEQRPFAAKYSAFYDEYNFDNRFFFVPRILLAVATGAIVGIVQDPVKQLLIILGVTVTYLALLILRKPNLLRFLYYIGFMSVFLKVILLCLMLALVQDDMFPQHVRDNVSYAIIGINVFIFFLLFLRQGYMVIYKISRACKNKGKNVDDDSDDESGYNRNDRRDVEQGRGPRYERLNSTDNGRSAPQPFPGDPYLQNQLQKQQNYMGGAAAAQQVNGYGNNDRGSGYGQQSGYGQNGANNGYDRNSANTGYGQNAANNGYGGYGNGTNDHGYGAAAGIAAGAVVGAGAAAAMNRQSNDQNATNNQYNGAGARAATGAGAPNGGAAAQPAGPAKFSWRRNTGADQAGAPVDTTAMYLYGGANANRNTGGGAEVAGAAALAAGAAAAGVAIASQQSSSPQKGYSTDDDDWMNINSNSATGSPAKPVTEFRDSDMNSSDQIANSSFLTADSYATNTQSGVREFRDTDLDNSSFLTADSYATNRQGTGLDTDRSLAMTDSSDEMALDTKQMDNLAVEYLHQAGASENENDLGDDDEDEDEYDELATTKGVRDSVDIDVDSEDDAQSVDVDVDDDSSGDEVDIDMISDRDTDTMLESGYDSNDDHDIKRVDEIGLRDSNTSATQSDASFIIARHSSTSDFERPMSQTSIRSDDDYSLYIDGRQDEPKEASAPTSAARSGPIKL